MRKKYQTRLEHAADELQAFKPSAGFRFNMAEFSNECGTAVCGAGYLARVPWFIDRGFMATARGTPKYEPDGVPFGPYRGSDGDCMAWDAIEEFFGVDKCEAEYLFDEDAYPKNITPQDVARRIRSFLRGGVPVKFEKKWERENLA